MDKFEKYSNYNSKSNFTQVRFGHDMGLLETELNEIQQIQEEHRLETMRKIVQSGFSEPVQYNFSGDPIIYNPVQNGLTLTDHIAIAPFKAIVNGYEINGQGNFSYNNLDNYILINLKEPGSESTKDTLVYLEVWFEISNGEDYVPEYGYYYNLVEDDFINQKILESPAMDSRIGAETSRRVRLCWDIRVKQECNFSTYPEGFGYKDVLHYSNILATASGQFGTSTNVNRVFAPATAEFFVNEPFYYDNNLYVGGRPSYEINSSTLYGQYVFALPMFRIRRRNTGGDDGNGNPVSTGGYAIDNYNGSTTYNKMYDRHMSRTAGDLTQGFRPDGYAYDVIDESDVIDLRKTITFTNYNNLTLADETVQNLFNNKLTTFSTEKMRRVQFGNKHMSWDEYCGVDENGETVSSGVNCKLVVPFNGTTLPYYPLYDTTNNVHTDTKITYQDSISGYGAHIVDDKQLVYNINNEYKFLTQDIGTVEFYLKPFWDGSDKNQEQIIFSVMNTSQQFSIRLRKQSHYLIFEAQNNIDQTLKSYQLDQATVDLSTGLLAANKYYHIRCVWCSDPLPLNGQMLLYINGNLVGQCDFSDPATAIVYHSLRIGDESNTNTKGFLIDNLLCYPKRFEQLTNNSGLYSYPRSKFWPMLPKDYIESDTLLMPACNGIVSNYGDCAYNQEHTIFQIYPTSVWSAEKTYKIGDTIIQNGAIYRCIINQTEKGYFHDYQWQQFDKLDNINDTAHRFYINLTVDKIVTEGLTVWDPFGNELMGVWQNVNSYDSDNNLLPTYFQITDSSIDQSIEYIIADCTIALSAGCGGQDMPTEILAASIIKYDDEADNYQYNLNITREISFNAYQSNIPRSVKYLKMTRVSSTSDQAYDFSNSTRTHDQCYARLIYYNISTSKAVNNYDIPIEVYGYEVIGVIGCNNKVISKIVKTPNDIYGEQDVKFTVYFEDALLVGETVTIYLACKGYSFDYELNSKTLIKNFSRCHYIEFEADGISSIYTKPCKEINETEMHGGILQSVLRFHNNTYDTDGNIILADEESDGTNNDNVYYVAYHDGEKYYDERGKVTDERLFNTIPIAIDESSFGTPFITIRFTEDTKPAKGTIIQVPVVTSYQVPEDEMLSIWYKYMPYQGVMTSSAQTVTRISDWTSFITTLSTGKDNDQLIRQNIVNSLPGGCAYGYQIDNKDIILTSVFNNMETTIKNYDLNKKLVFMNNFMLPNNEEICNLLTQYRLQKDSTQFQDGLISFLDIDFNQFFIDCKDAINKYIGSFCLVTTESGEICVLLIGKMCTTPTIENHLEPIYGDLFRIKGRPCIKNN